MNYEFGAQVSGPSVVCHYAIEEIYLRVDSCHTDDLLADAVGPGPSVYYVLSYSRTSGTQLVGAQRALANELNRSPDLNSGVITR